MNRRTLLASVLALTLGAGFVGGWLAHQPQAQVVVPDVQGLPTDRAADLLHRAGLRVDFTDQVPATTLPHQILVVQQIPSPGRLVSPATTIQLRVKLGPVIPTPIS